MKNSLVAAAALRLPAVAAGFFRRIYSIRTLVCNLLNDDIYGFFYGKSAPKINSGAAMRRFAKGLPLEVRACARFRGQATINI